MEEVGLSVEAGHPDQGDYPLDLDAEAGGDDFNFEFETSYQEDSKQDATEVDITNATNATIADFEIGFEVEEAEVAGTSTKQEITEATEKGDIDYDDEIGYEDEEPVAAEIATDASAQQASVADTQSPSGLASNEQDKQFIEAAKAQPELSEDMTADVQTADNQELEYEQFEEISQPPETDNVVSAAEAADTAEESGLDNPVGDSNVQEESTQGEDLSEHRSPGTAFDELENAATEASDSLHEVPDITVFYNEGSYALFGSPDDDPDSYFLPDAEALDRPLSELFASIRDILSEEIKPQDELQIRIDSLSLEFGEKSRKRFLRRSLREIADCYNALLDTNIVKDPTLVLDLVVRQDCEERFMELLEDAGIIDKSHPSEHSGASSEDEHSSVDNAEEDYLDDENLEEDYQDEEVNAEAMTDDAGQGEVESGLAETESKPNTSTKETDDDAADSVNLQATSTEMPSANLDQHEPKGEENFEEYQDFYLEYDKDDVLEDGEEYANNDMDISGQGDMLATDQALGDSGLSFEQITEQHTEGHDVFPAGDQANGVSNLSDGQEATAETGAPTILESGLHGNFPPFIVSEGFDSIQGNTHGSSSRQDGSEGSDLIDYTDDEEPTLVTESGAKRKLSSENLHAALKRARTDDFQLDLEPSHLALAYDRYTQESNLGLPGPASISKDSDELSASIANAHTTGDASSSWTPNQSSGENSPSNSEFFMNRKGYKGRFHSRKISDLSIAFSSRSNTDLPPPEDKGFALDHDAALAAVDEHQADEDSQEHDYDDAADLDEAEGTLEGDLQHDVPDFTTDLTSENPSNGAHDAIAQAALSNHSTSTSTLNGDEIDYEDNNLQIESFSVEVETKVSAAVPSGDGDEIDWGNDDEEDEMTEHKEADLTPSSISGKRTIADLESSVDETGTSPPYKLVKTFC